MTKQTVRAKLARITPQIAALLIEEHNTHNRDVKWPRVMQYANDIRNDNWVVNGEAIKIAATGEILDGQHRLLAVLEADKAITTVLITGLDLAAQESMDQGEPRRFYDALKLRGEHDYFVLAAATRIVALFERYGVPYAITGHDGVPSNHEMFRTLARNPEIRDACRHAGRLRNPWLPVSAIAGLLYLFSAVDPAAATDFFDTLITDGPTDGGERDPAVFVRHRLIEAHLSPSDARLHVRTKMAYVIQAWNARQADVVLTAVGWRAPTPFPQINGLMAVALTASG